MAIVKSLRVSLCEHEQPKFFLVEPRPKRPPILVLILLGVAGAELLPPHALHAVEAARSGSAASTVKRGQGKEKKSTNHTIFAGFVFLLQIWLKSDSWPRAH